MKKLKDMKGSELLAYFIMAQAFENDGKPFRIKKHPLSSFLRNIGVIDDVELAVKESTAHVLSRIVYSVKAIAIAEKKDETIKKEKEEFMKDLIEVIEESLEHADTNIIPNMKV